MKQQKYLPLLQKDAWLHPCQKQIAKRFLKFHETMFGIEAAVGNLYDFATMHNYLGLTIDNAAGGFYFREWAPKAQSIHLVGDLNLWDRQMHPLKKFDNGVWEIFLPFDPFKDRLKHGSRFKILVKSKTGSIERLPALAKRVVQDEKTKDFSAQVWFPAIEFIEIEIVELINMPKVEKPIQWAEKTETITEKTTEWVEKDENIVAKPIEAIEKDETVDIPTKITKKWQAVLQDFEWDGFDDFKLAERQELLIYEAHVGMAQEEERVGTYLEFAEKVLPRVKAAGYNTIQLMAVQEHPYYGSFGYHVSSFFAPCSRFGTPEDLKTLIKKAHELGIAVVMDLVHSHAVKNVYEGLNMMDGTDSQYFHAGERGNHAGWDSKVFNYGKWEVIQFLLSNVRYWLEEFHFDGFRFDGVTSMLYVHHGNMEFDKLEKYFDEGVDNEAITYLQLANQLAHTIKTDVLTIAEDVSGMPGLCRPIAEGGIGFDYRLAMGIPDYWTKLAKDIPDEHWNIGDMFYTMTNRRFDEKHIAYVESHDQALVGDQTLAFRLMGGEMYRSMSVFTPNLTIDRGMALHKLTRLFTIVLGGEGYLNFMGNEFGHPEWIDFPREGNEWSFRYARRQWSLAADENLRYRHLANFDRAMIELVKKYDLLNNKTIDHQHKFRKGAWLINEDKENKTLIFKKNDLIFAFNFHPTASIADYKFWVDEAAKYELVLNSDDETFGGHARVETDTAHFTDQTQHLSVYLTNRTVLVFKKMEEEGL